MSTRAAAQVAQQAPRGEARHYPIGHFEIYVGEWFERAVADQTEFLTSHLLTNVFEPEWDAERDAPPFRWRRARLGKQAGARDLGASLFEVPPGAATFPLHAHFANEELLVVLSGRPTLTTRAGERELAPGEVVAFPAGEARRAPARQPH